MDDSTLTRENIFLIPAGEMWGVGEERIFMVYAPLNGTLSLADPESARHLELCARGESDDASHERALAQFRAQGSVPVYRMPHTPHDLYQVDILPNYTCNFKCVYCYSAAGRSSQQVDFEKIKAVMDYLFGSEKKQVNPYIISFSGGGEPLLSFDLIKKTVAYIEKVNPHKAYQYSIGLVTNGSLITPEIVDYLHEKEIDMAVSFEILERLQNKERGSYDKVAAHIDMMLDKGYPFGIRSTFTPHSVSCMCEMIEELSARFPRLKKVVFDTVLSPALFPTPQSLELYYNTFVEQYYKAKQLGAEKGIAVESIAVETLSMVRDRTCEGKIVLTPMGTLSSCARVSSPQERLYNEYIYGKVEDGKLLFDEDKFKAIISQSNIYSQPMCERCFAKWNCGGGCRLFHQSFGSDFEEVRCRFVRKGLKIQLFQLLCRQHFQNTGKDLKELIAGKIERGEL